MNDMIVDLHIHSTCSDGTYTPERIVSEALARGIGCISVCDHNVTAGTLATAALARQAGLRCIPGVEIDSILDGVDAHILCYGADLDNPALAALIRHARARLDFMSDELLTRMLPDYPGLDYDEYLRLPHNPALGGWKLLQYLQAKGVTLRLNDALPLYDRYGVTYADAGFAPAEEVIPAIHAAGGCAVLAHPGVTFPADPLAGTLAALRLGADGAECFYPRHSDALTSALESLCLERNLLVTAGSDCHGGYGRTCVGQTRTPLSRLRLHHPSLQPFWD